MTNVFVAHRIKASRDSYGKPTFKTRCGKILIHSEYTFTLAEDNTVDLDRISLKKCQRCFSETRKPKRSTGGIEWSREHAEDRGIA